MAAIQLCSAYAAELRHDLEGVADARRSLEEVGTPPHPALPRTARRCHPAKVAIGWAMPSHVLPGGDVQPA
eukprot:6785712-Alexandrium_andersonii.AAC.1